ncbi:unnamed protein product [Rhodiola kirilowii]
MEAVKEKAAKLQIRRTATQIINLGVLLSSALIFWKIWVCLCGTVSPLTVVVSGSMEPGFKRGDALLLHMNNSPIRAGEIVVFSVEGKEIYIVHRVIKVHQETNATQVNFILTKGDNNSGDDRWGGIYADGQEWVEQKDILGRVFGILPYAGWPSIIVNEHPLVKYFLLGSLSLLAIMTDS